MRKISFILVSYFFYLNSSFANLHDYVENLKVGESLLDYFSKEELNQVDDWLSYAVEYSLLDLSTIKKDLLYFEGLMAAVKKDDPNYIIQGLQGMKFFTNSSECERQLAVDDKYLPGDIKDKFYREEKNMRAKTPIQGADLHIILYTTSSLVYSNSCWKLDEKFDGNESIFMMNRENLSFSEYFGAKTYIY